MTISIPSGGDNDRRHMPGPYWLSDSAASVFPASAEDSLSAGVGLAGMRLLEMSARDSLEAPSNMPGGSSWTASSAGRRFHPDKPRG